MAALADPSVEPAKILMIGENGAGKTGSLISLVRAGYNVRILDLDNGTEILSQSLSPEDRKRVDVETHQDEYTNSPVFGVMPKVPLKGFSGAMKVLTSWPGLGSPTTWGINDVLVVDSLTLLGKYILNHVMQVNNMIGKPPQLQHWGQAMDLQENVLALLFSNSIKCNVIVMAHITYIQPEGEVVQRAYASALGSKLPPKVGSYFNSTLYVRSEGTPRKRFIYTDTVGLVECKTPAPGKVEKKYPIETGLADYFRALGQNPAVSS